jgi:hypothetical protein
MNVPEANITHALYHDCQDPDCEIHNPDVIEDEPSRLTSLAFFHAGGRTALGLVEEGLKAGFTIDQALSAAYAEIKDSH